MKASLQQMYNQLASQKAINDKKKNTIETNLEMMHKYEIIMRQKKDILLDIEEKAVETLHIKKYVNPFLLKMKIEAQAMHYFTNYILGTSKMKK